MMTIVLQLVTLQTVKAHLIAKGLRRVVDDDGAGQVSPQNPQVFDVVAVDAHAVLPEQPVPGESTIREHTL